MFFEYQNVVRFHGPFFLPQVLLVFAAAEGWYNSADPLA